MQSDRGGEVTRRRSREIFSEWKIESGIVKAVVMTRPRRWWKVGKIDSGARDRGIE